MKQWMSTDTVPRAQRLAYWTDMICSVYVQLGCDAPVRSRSTDFDGRIGRRALPGLEVSVVHACAQQVHRTRAHIAQAGDERFLASIQVRGRGVVRQDGRDALLGPGDFALYDSTRPYDLLFDDRFEQIVLQLPAERLRRELREPQALTATTVRGGAGRLLAQMARQLSDDEEEGTWPPAAALAVADGVVSVLAGALQSLPAAARTPAPTRLAAYHLARAKQFIEERLADPELGIEQIAQALGLSASQLHRVFEHEPLAPAHYIRERRLEACSRDLLDPSLAGQAVSTLAYARGFNDAAHFSRAFRARFGVSPREWRQMPRP